MAHTLPKLQYTYNSLEPFIDEETMRIHHTKHHQTYIDKLNLALDVHKELQNKILAELMADLNSIPQDIRNAVKNHGGGHLNHSMFWELLKKDVALDGDIAKEMDKRFGSFENFKKEFSAAAAGVFGSGWAWLVSDKGKLEIMTTPNQDSPVSVGKKPILGLDVWEHAYYLKYQNKRAEYIEAFFKVINWSQVNKNLKAAK